MRRKMTHYIVRKQIDEARSKSEPKPNRKVIVLLWEWASRYFDYIDVRQNASRLHNDMVTMSMGR